MQIFNLRTPSILCLPVKRKREKETQREGGGGRPRERESEKRDELASSRARAPIVPYKYTLNSRCIRAGYPRCTCVCTYGCPACARMRGSFGPTCCTGRRVAADGEPRRRMNEWILRQSWVWRIHETASAPLRDDLFFEKKPHGFSLPSPFSSSPSFLRIVRVSRSRLNERFVIRTFAEVACACMSRVMLCRFVFRLSRFSSFLSFPLHLPRLPSLRILSSFDFPWLFFFSLSRLFHAIANIGSLSASGWSSNCTGYQKLWHCARKIKKIFGEKRRDQRASAGTNLLTKVRFLMGISRGFFISRIKVAKCVENYV